MSYSSMHSMLVPIIILTYMKPNKALHPIKNRDAVFVG